MKFLLLLLAFTSLSQPIWAGPLYDAVRNEDFDRVESLLSGGINVDEKGMGELTPLHLAVMRGYEDVVRLLISHGANVNAKHTLMETPLVSAVQAGNEALVQLLITHGANVNELSRHTPLHVAIERGHEEVAALLISHGAEVNAKDWNGGTPLHEAAKWRNPAFAELLIGYGADVNAKDRSGRTPLHVAVNERSPAVAELLQAHGADINAEMLLHGTPLHRAASAGNMKMAESLIAKGANINPTGYFFGTPLHHAALSGNSELAELLVAKGADVNATGYSGTPLHRAASAGNKEMVELLIAKGADVNAKDRSGRTPLHYAVLGGDTAFTKMLVSKMAGEELSKKIFKDSPSSLKIDHLAIAEILLTHGADINAKIKDGGLTLLHLTVKQGNKEAVEFLLSHGANPDAVDDNGFTARQLARKNNHHEIVALLSVAAGVKNTIQDKAVGTQLSLSEEKGPTGEGSHPSEETVLETQALLKNMGYDPGPIDGIWGNKSKQALAKYQADHSMPETGLLDSSILDALKIESGKSSESLSRSSHKIWLVAGKVVSITESQIAFDSKYGPFRLTEATRYYDVSDSTAKKIKPSNPILTPDYAFEEPKRINKFRILPGTEIAVYAYSTKKDADALAIRDGGIIQVFSLMKDDTGQYPIMHMLGVSPAREEDPIVQKIRQSEAGTRH